jgi:hypothetical protein
MRGEDLGKAPAKPLGSAGDQRDAAGEIEQIAHPDIPGCCNDREFQRR